MTATAIRAAIEAAYADIPADPALALQAAVRDRLASSETLTAIVPPRLIANRPQHPNEYPCITFGDPQTVAREVVFSRQHADVFLDLHIWTQEGGTIAARQLAAIVRAILFSSPLATPEIELAHFRHIGTRILRDPSGDHGHAIVSLEALAGWRQ